MTSNIMNNEERIEDTEEWQDQAKQALLDIGLTEDEAERQLEEYIEI